MNRALKIIGAISGAVSLCFGSVVALVGFFVLFSALYGLIIGMHGGPIAALIMAFFGGVIAFVGVMAGRYGVSAIRKKNKTDRNPEAGENVAT